VSVAELVPAVAVRLGGAVGALEELRTGGGAKQVEV
jgi:hypothetical protein